MSAASTPPVSRLTSLALLLTATLTIMAGATIAPSLPEMGAHFRNVPQAELLVRLVLTLPALMIALASPLMGSLSDRWGRKPLLVLGMALYVLAGAAGAVIENIWLLLLSRALLGVGVAGILTANTALMADLFDGPARGRILGMQGVFTNVGGALFLVAGGLLAQQNWHAPFLIYLLPLLLLPLVWTQIPNVRPQNTPRLQAEATPAALPWGKLWPIYAAGFLTFLLFYQVPTQVPFYLTERFGASSSVSGSIVALTNVAGVVAGLLFVRLGQRFAAPQLSAYAMLAIGAGLVLIGLASGYAGVVAGVFLLGLGVGVNYPNFTAWLTRLAPPAVRGRAIGMLSSSVFLGQFLSPLASQPIAAATSPSAMFWLTGIVAVLVGLPFFRVSAD